jgi:DNA uptake protein ComE-like DNA-binding protein
MKPLKSLCPLSFALLLTANLVFAQFGGQRLPTTPPTFPQQKSSDRPELIDINSASKEQLLTLPGIDESRAEKIIETRPYKNKKELKKKKIVPEEVYKQISDKITATPPDK